MATLQQIHSLLQQLTERSDGNVVSIYEIAEMLENCPDFVRHQVELLEDLKFAKVISNDEAVILTQTGRLAKVEAPSILHRAYS
jgi:hypothetical protein